MFEIFGNLVKTCLKVKGTKWILVEVLAVVIVVNQISSARGMRTWAQRTPFVERDTVYVFQCVAVCEECVGSVLQCVAVCCSVLQCAAL